MNEVMVLKELADYLRVHPSTLYRLLKTRRIPSFRIGSDYRFNRNQIDQWMKAQEQNGKRD